MRSLTEIEYLGAGTCTVSKIKYLINPQDQSLNIQKVLETYYTSIGLMYI